MDRPLMRPVATAAIVALLAAACGSPAPSASPSAAASPSPSSSAPVASPSASGSGGDEAVYAAINEQVRAIRGLQEKTPVEPTIVSPDEMTQVLKDSFSEDYPPTGRRRRAAVPRPRAASEGRQAGRPLHRPPVEPGGRPVRPDQEEAVRRLQAGRHRRGGEGLLLARVRPCPAGPELRPPEDAGRSR